MNDSSFVKVLECFEYLFDEVARILFGVAAFLYDAIEQLATGHPEKNDNMLFTAHYVHNIPSRCELTEHKNNDTLHTKTVLL